MEHYIYIIIILEVKFAFNCFIKCYVTLHIKCIMPGNNFYALYTHSKWNYTIWNTNVLGLLNLNFYFVTFSLLVDILILIEKQCI